jgi:hypothetical protein
MPSSGMLRRVALVRTTVRGTYRLHYQSERINALGTLAVSSNRSYAAKNLHSVLRLLVTVNVVSSSSIFFTLMLEGLRYSDQSVLIRATWRNIPEDCIFHSHHCDNLKSYMTSQTLELFTERENVI